MATAVAGEDGGPSFGGFDLLSAKTTAKAAEVDESVVADALKPFERTIEARFATSATHYTDCKSQSNLGPGQAA